MCHNPEAHFVKGTLMSRSKSRRPIMPIFALSILAAFGAAPAAATENCSHAATQTDINICADRAAKAADAELNTVYRQVQSRLKDSPEGHKGLVAAQRAWIAFRDAECRFAASGVGGGSAMPMVMSNCLAQVTRRRADDLKAWLSCPEGDFGCPVPPN